MVMYMVAHVSLFLRDWNTVSQWVREDKAVDSVHLNVHIRSYGDFPRLVGVAHV